MTSSEFEYNSPTDASGASMSINQYNQGLYTSYFQQSPPPDKHYEEIQFRHFAKLAKDLLKHDGLSIIEPSKLSAYKQATQHSLPPITATIERRPPHPLDAELRRSFQPLLNGISFQDIATPSGEKSIAHPDKFRFVPLLSEMPDSPTLLAAGFDNQAPPGIRQTYPETGIGMPYLDTRQAVGLVYGDWLVALAAAGIKTVDGVLEIRQIQDVTGVKKDTDKRAFYRTGLHNGFSWRQTLVEAWQEIGKGLGAETIAVQSHINSPWGAVQQYGKAGYDDVAKDMGYTKSPITKNWHKDL